MDQEEDSYKEFEETLETSHKNGKYILRLFIAGINPRSKKALENLMEICEKNLKDKYELEVIDIYQKPIFAKEGHIIAAPTLIKELPLPIRRFVGDLSDKDKVLLGLDIRTKKDSDKKKVNENESKP